MNLDGTVHYFEFYKLFSQMDRDKDFSVSPRELTEWLVSNQGTICRPYAATINKRFGKRPSPKIRQHMPVNEYTRACKELFRRSDKNENRKLNFAEF
jgi:Ca2+-binding EF-hand superfamily protein